MTAETDLYTALTGAAGVTAIVSTRIYPDLAPQEVATPCIAYSRTGTEYITTIHSSVPLGSIATIEVWCMATTRTTADALAVAVETAAGAAGFVPQGRTAVVPDADPQVIASIVTLTKYN